AATPDILANVPVSENPRPLHVMADHADYWVDAEGEVFTFTFPATLDLDGQHNRTGPYFNL
ncbi:uncharacterized protein HD556DRAFT_1204586, partial [Suillus plorans]